MSGRWFRLYEGLIDDPKVQRLPAETFRALVNLWCLSSRGGGVLPAVEDIAFGMRATTEYVTNLLKTLVELNLLDEEDGVFRPHNWGGRQFQSDVSTERVQRHRNAKRNADETFRETPSSVSVSVSVSESLSEKEVRREFGEQFWPGCPNKVGKPKAETAFIAARKLFSLKTILDGQERYKATKPPDRQWLNPATFLNQHRFNDEPAPVATSPPTKSRTTQAGERLLEEIRNGKFGPGIRDQSGADVVAQLPEPATRRRHLPAPTDNRLHREAEDVAPDDG